MPLLVGRSRALEIIVSSEEYDADIAERYGWINRAIPDAELDDFVDRFARRIASFDKAVLTEAKRLVNRASRLADDAQLVAVGTAFFLLLSRHETQARISSLMKRGLQQHGDFELTLGDKLGTEQMSDDPNNR